MKSTLFNNINIDMKYMSVSFPNILKELYIIEKEIEKIENSILRNTAIDSLYSARQDCNCYSIFQTFSSADKKNSSKFISSIAVLASYLEALCSRKELLGTESSSYLYNAFLNAIIPDRPLINYYAKCPYKNDGGFLSFLVYRCREAIEELPYHNIVKSSLEEYSLKYYSFYVNTFSSHLDISEAIMSWSESNYSKNGLITCMEYSAACSNLSLIIALFSTGYDASADDGLVKDIIYFYFPWVNSLYSLLDSYIRLQNLEEADNKNINFCIRYANQKICENRIIYIYKMVYENLQIINNNVYHVRFIKLFISRFLTDHRAYIGINNITTRNLLNSIKHIDRPSNKLYSFIKVIAEVAAG